MRQRSPMDHSSHGNGYIRSDIDHNVEPHTNMTDVNESTDNGNKNDDDDDDDDEAWLFPNEDHSPKYYLRQLEVFDEKDYAEQDYKDRSTRLLDRMGDQWNRYVSFPSVACARTHTLTLAKMLDVPQERPLSCLHNRIYCYSIYIL